MIRIQIGCANNLVTRLLFFTLVISSLGYGQDYRPNALPPSPEAANLGKYAEIPVGYYTGTPGVEIPLYTITDGSLKVPVSLSYHAMGNRVEDVATYAGLGWTLNAGGVVTRSVRNRPDDDENNGFFDYTSTVTYSHITSTTEYTSARLMELKLLADGCRDTEPDAYFFNFNGFTGSFTFDWAGANIVTDSKIVWKIKLLKELPAYPKRITGWEFTGDDGTIYTFKEIENTKILNNLSSCLAGQQYNSAWYLTNISSANKNRSINLTYEPYALDLGYNLSISSTVSYGGGTTDGDYPNPCDVQVTERFNNSYTKLSYSGKRISTISSSDNASTIAFNYNTLRTDEQGSTMKSLDEIIIKNKENIQIKKYGLAYDYSTGRLTLKSITEQNSSSFKPPYKFAYNQTALPPRVPISTSVNGYNSFFSQDHWGFYNGAQNKTLVPPTIHLFPIPYVIRYFEGGDRSPNPYYMNAGVLTSITYPTGGIDKYTYEPHEYGFIQNISVQSKGEYEKDSQFASVEAVNNIGIVTSLPFMVEGNAGELIVVHLNVKGKKNTNTATDFNYDPHLDLLDGNGNAVAPRLYIDYNSNTEDSKYNEVYLAPGTYKLRAYCYKNSEYVNCYMEWRGRKIVNGNTVPVIKKMAGGLRIKEINRFAYEGDPLFTTRQFLYTFQDDISKSSGVITNEPMYETTDNSSYRSISPFPYFYPFEAECGYLLRLSQSRTPLGVSGGSHLCYREVTELMGPGGINGKNIYNFTSQFDHYDYVPLTKPFSPPTSASYYNGQLQSQKTYKNVNGILSLVAKDTSVFTDNLTSVRGYKVSFDGGLTAPFYIQYFAKFHCDPYYISMGRVQPVETVHTEVPTEGGTPVSKKTQFTYDAKLQYLKSKSSFLNDAADLDKLLYYYPTDFTSPTPEISSMVTKNIIASPLEVVSQRTKGGTTVFTGAVFTRYAVNGASRIFPAEIKKLQLANPSATFDYAFDNANGSVDARYATEITFDKYDAKENIAQYTAKNGITSTLLWDYYNSNPVVAVNNATADQFIYTGFEDTNPVIYSPATNSINGTYSTTEFATGKRSLTAGTLSVATNTFSAVRYSLSFWLKGSCTLLVNGAAQTVPATTQWNVFEIKITGGQPVNITVPANSFIDEVRIIPADAQMSSYAYDQLVGVNTITDARSNPALFNYDNLGRLHLVKDQNKDIVKRINYEYDILTTPSSNFTLQATLNANYSFLFQVQGSGGAAYTYEWDFGDGTTQTTTTSSVTHLFPVITLNYTVKVTVKNAGNTLANLQATVLSKKQSGSSTECNEINAFTAEKVPYVPFGYKFTAPTLSGVQYSWDFGDANSTALGNPSNYTYTGKGTYKVTLSISAGSKTCLIKKSLVVPDYN